MSSPPRTRREIAQNRQQQSSPQKDFIKETFSPPFRASKRKSALSSSRASGKRSYPSPDDVTDKWPLPSTKRVKSSITFRSEESSAVTSNNTNPFTEIVKSSLLSPLRYLRGGLFNGMFHNNRTSSATGSDFKYVDAVPLAHKILDGQLVAPDFTNLPDLISEDVGGRVLFSTDEFFARTSNLLKPEPPVWKEGKFTVFGKWMDGWETQRRRQPKHDWCIIELGIPGIIRGVEVSTRFFTGNNAPYFSIEGAHCTHLSSSISKLVGPSDDNHAVGGVVASKESINKVNDYLEYQHKQDPMQWNDIIGMSKLQPGTSDIQATHYFDVSPPPVESQAQKNGISNGTQPSIDRRPITHIRFNLFPDGGVARLRLYGVVAKDFHKEELEETEVDLTSVLNGARIVSASNKHYGDPKNLLLRTVPMNMSSGWETARNPVRAPFLESDVEGLVLNLIGEEWVIIKLCTRATVSNVEVDTTHFRGNFPESCQAMGVDLDSHLRKSSDRGEEKRMNDTCDLKYQKEYFEKNKKSLPWKPLLTRTKLFPHQSHSFSLGLFGSSLALNGSHTPPDQSTIPSQPLEDAGAITHVCFTIFPDGGVSRLRMFGVPHSLNM